MNRTGRTLWIVKRLVDGERVNRAAICARFGVSRTTAATDLRRLGDRNPGLMRYDSSAKSHFASPSSVAAWENVA